MELPGYQPFEGTLTRNVSGWVFANLLFGGLIGIAVDAAGGGMYDLEPKQLTAYLVKDESKPTPAPVPAPAPNGPVAAMPGPRLKEHYDGAYLFLRPHPDAERLTRVSSRMPLKLIETRPQWVYVETSDERRGWLLHEWIQN
jgi:hypothetical protein